MSEPDAKRVKLEVHKGCVYVVCPFGGFECAHIDYYRQGLQMAQDTMDVHVQVSHKRWS